MSIDGQFGQFGWPPTPRCYVNLYIFCNTFAASATFLSEWHYYHRSPFHSNAPALRSDRCATARRVSYRHALYPFRLLLGVLKVSRHIIVCHSFDDAERLDRGHSSGSLLGILSSDTGQRRSMNRRAGALRILT